MAKAAKDYYKSGTNKTFEIPQQNFILNKYYQIYTKRFDKELKITSNKRIIKGNNTYPFGYIE